MKIICIGRNYIEHAKELKNPVPLEPVFFLKPDSAILRNGKPFFYPGFSEDIHHEIEIVVKISKLGRHIEEKFAGSYYEEIGLGIDFTARDRQKICKEKGLPWEIAKAFDHSAPLGGFINKNEFANISDINFHLDLNGVTVQQGSTKDMIFSIDAIISYVSKFMTLKTGDLIYTGTPSGVGPVAPGDRLEGYIGDTKMLWLNVK